MTTRSDETARAPFTMPLRLRRGRPVRPGAIDWEFDVALLVFAAFVALAVAGVFLQHRATAIDVANALESPSGQHWFGTDSEGRDVFARVAVGTIISFAAAAATVLIGAAGGVLIAVTCGLGPRWLDTVLMRLTDTVLAFPQLLLALAISVALGPGLISAGVGIVVTIIPIFARTLRAEAVRSRSEPFIESARTIGLSTPHIAVRHVVPYLSTTLTVQVAANFGAAVLTLAGLSFIGVGAQPPTPEWGAMITDGLQNALTGQWWIGVCPGMALLLLVASLNVLSDRVRARGGLRRKAGAL
ncbi:MAG TPA: ABC transporter permease [Gryllotalpicola sp.]